MNKITMILIIALGLRLWGISWDQGFHLHPDERALILVAERLHFFSQLDPNFFNYGSLPLYLLRGTSQLVDFFFFTKLANYDGMLVVGRLLSTAADLGTVFLIYLISLKLWSNKTAAHSASLLYAIAFFPIQNSHFFIVDTFLTLFVTGILYALLLYIDKPERKRLFVLGIISAAAFATKFTAVINILFVIITILHSRKNVLKNLLFFSFSFLVFSFLFMPYAFLHYPKYLTDVLAQLKLNNNPYTFPYTLQYVGTLPYLYYLKNIFLWGLGPVISILTLGGFVLCVKNIFSKSKKFSIFNFQFSIFFLFYLFYFLIIGKSAVKFMRYMLPMYPFFTALAGYAIYRIRNYELRIKNRHISVKTLMFLPLLAALVWTFMFLSIYMRPHTRILATNWILRHAGRGSTLAVEHWDDRLPLVGSEQYSFVELALYEQPDNETKWEELNGRLRRADYLIISSNRLYVPITRLNNCSLYPICYPRASRYYQDLFSEKLGLTKVAEFTSYPAFFLFKLQDDSADESFTVYDHPKVIIFARKGQ